LIINCIIQSPSGDVWKNIFNTDPVLFKSRSVLNQTGLILFNTDPVLFNTRPVLFNTDPDLNKTGSVLNIFLHTPPEGLRSITTMVLGPCMKLWIKIVGGSLRSSFLHKTYT